MKSDGNRQDCFKHIRKAFILNKIKGLIHLKRGDTLKLPFTLAF